jgi:dTDP-4-amino-4,6-dideoxygalactose transaminase
MGDRRIPRRIAVLGGTTTWADCVVATRLLLRPQQLVDGPAIDAYEDAFAGAVGAAHGVSFAHGRVGLYALLHELGVGPGDEVIVPAPTHVVVPNAVRYLGAVPVFADARLDTYNTDLEAAHALVSDRSRAIVVQHTFGNPADLEAVAAFGERHGIAVIEDCVHALGATYRGRPLGCVGRAAFFSTEETKTISTTMGGMVTTNDAELAAGVRRMQQRADPPASSLVAGYLLKLVVYHVLTAPHLNPYAEAVYQFFGRRHPLPDATADDEKVGERPPGYLQRFSNGQAVIGLRQLERLEQNVVHRRSVTRTYDTLLGGRLEAGVSHAPGAEPALVRYPVRVRNRVQVVRRLWPRVALGQWFTSVLEEAEDLARVGYSEGTASNAELLARELVNLPTHPRVTRADAERIAAELLEAAEG